MLALSFHDARRVGVEVFDAKAVVSVVVIIVDGGVVCRILDGNKIE